MKIFLTYAGHPFYTENISALSQYFVEMGIFFYWWQIIVYDIIASPFFYVSRGFFSILFPPIWCLLAIAGNFKEVRDIRCVKNFRFFKRVRKYINLKYGNESVKSQK